MVPLTHSISSRLNIQNIQTSEWNPASLETILILIFHHVYGGNILIFLRIAASTTSA